jgi:hypothetical protein
MKRIEDTVKKQTEQFLPLSLLFPCSREVCT